ncbi:hypothetical protein [Methylorubrum rhodinum]|nr:hypothetical protein [Methylorubrum rhodinum]
MDELYELRNVLFIDVGFSIPYLLMQKRFANRNDIFSILIDKEQNCKIFYDFINQTVHQNRSELDSVIIADIEYEEDQKSIISFAKNIVQRESVNVLFICGSELVEHLNDKENFWTFCKGIEEIGVNTLCYVTLPIGKKIPSHNFHFIDEDCAYLELEKHMILSKIEVLRPSADAVSPYLTSCFCAFGSIRHLPEEGNSR